MQKLLVVAFMATSCVTTHVGKTISALDGKIASSCGYRAYAGTERFRFVSCTLQNTSKDWVEFAIETVAFTGQQEEGSVLTAQQTIDFMNAYRYHESMRGMNAAGVLGTLMVAGLIAGAAGGSSSGGRAGAVTALAGAGTVVGTGLVKGQQSAQHDGERFANEEPIRLPAGLFVRRAFILEIPSEKFITGTVRMCFKEPSDACMDVPLAVTSAEHQANKR